MVHTVVCFVLHFRDVQIQTFLGAFSWSLLFCIMLICSYISFFLACLVQRSGWTRDVDIFLHWLSSIQFGGGGFNEVATAEGLAEALMVGNLIFYHLWHNWKYICLGHFLLIDF